MYSFALAGPLGCVKGFRRVSKNGYLYFNFEQRWKRHYHVSQSKHKDAEDLL